MKNLGFTKLDTEEAINIHGGNWFTDALEALEELVVNDIQEAIDEAIETINEYLEN